MNIIKTDPNLIFHSSGSTSYVTWNVVIPFGCLKVVFDRWLSKAPWTALLTVFQRLNTLDTIDRKTNIW